MAPECSVMVCRMPQNWGGGEIPLKNLLVGVYNGDADNAQMTMVSSITTLSRLCNLIYIYREFKNQVGSRKNCLFSEVWAEVQRSSSNTLKALMERRNFMQQRNNTLILSSIQYLMPAITMKIEKLVLVGPQVYWAIPKDTTIIHVVHFTKSLFCSLSNQRVFR